MPTTRQHVQMQQRVIGHIAALRLHNDSLRHLLYILLAETLNQKAVERIVLCLVSHIFEIHPEAIVQRFPDVHAVGILGRSIGLQRLILINRQKHSAVNPAAISHILPFCSHLRELAGWLFKLYIERTQNSVLGIH